MNVGIIGVGLLGSKHAKVISKQQDTQLTGVADSRAGTAEKIAAEEGCRAYSDYRALLRSEPLDCVIVATPDPFHRDPVIDAARAGISTIITEKPLATTPADAKKMQNAVLKAGSSLYILFPNRFDPLDRVTRYAFAHDLIGAPVHGDVRLDDSITVPKQLWGRRSRKWSAGSSTAHFLLSHVVDLLRWYFQPAEIVEVFAVSQNAVLGFTPDLYDAFLTFDSGLTVRVKAEWIRHIEALVEFELTFSGERGGIVYRKHPAFASRRGLRLDVDGASQTALTRHLKRLGGQGIHGRVVLDPDGRSPGAIEFRTEENPQDESVALAHYLRTIAEKRNNVAIEGFGPLPGLDDAMRQVEVVAAIIRSAEKGRVVPIRQS